MNQRWKHTLVKILGFIPQSAQKQKLVDFEFGAQPGKQLLQKPDLCIKAPKVIGSDI